MLCSSSRSAIPGSLLNWRNSVSKQLNRHLSHDLTNQHSSTDLSSLGQISFTSIADLRIHNSHPPINLLPRFDLSRLPSPSGHIYYHTPPGRPSICSELRFRTTGEDGQAQDWALPNKIPWALPIWRIVKNPILGPLKELLVEDGIVTPSFIERCERVFPEDFATVAPNRVIYGLRQPFPVHVCRNKTMLWIVSEEKVLDLNIGSSWLGHPHTRQKNHKGADPSSILPARISMRTGNTMAELDYREDKGYILRVVKEPPMASPYNHRSIYKGRYRPLRCYSLTTPDYLPVLEQLVGH
ncbi:hypothetical protein GGU10DRAFT_379317 [Lentinula aff. detonsa]|uniref:Uncharacterized protein n=1 Tax=Lentinula aff. detonsa TaxID=2804958 RepID=A0AA38KDX2_9AGAR|nr:hypothetical protein GGU10DRAFT_379317 [Lentinula aff. detonsa]